jgi:predicted ester cyclase
MSDANKELTRQFYLRLSAADLGVVDELVSDDFVEHEEIPGLEPTKAGARQMFEMFQGAFDHPKFNVEDIIAEGDKVSVRLRLTGTHHGEFMGIPATGRAINVGICDSFRIGNGTILEHWGVMDTAAPCSS